MTSFNWKRWFGVLLVSFAASSLFVACGDDAQDEANDIRNDCKNECENFAFFDCVSSSNVADCVDGCNTASLSDAEAFTSCASGGICKGTECLERFDIVVNKNPDAPN